MGGGGAAGAGSIGASAFSVGVASPFLTAPKPVMVVAVPAITGLSLSALLVSPLRVRISPGRGGTNPASVAAGSEAVGSASDGCCVSSLRDAPSCSAGSTAFRSKFSDCGVATSSIWGSVVSTLAISTAGSGSVVSVTSIDCVVSLLAALSRLAAPSPAAPKPAIAAPRPVEGSGS